MAFFPLSRGREIAEMAMKKNNAKKQAAREKSRIQLFKPTDADDPYSVYSGDSDENVDETEEETLRKNVMIALTPTKDKESIVQKQGDDEEDVEDGKSLGGVITLCRNILNSYPVATTENDEREVTEENDEREVTGENDEREVTTENDERADVATETRGKKRKRKGKNERRQEMSAKHPMLKACGCKAKRCHTKVDDATREIIYSHFWNLDYDARRLWIFNHVDQFQPKRRRTDVEASKRQLSRSYWLPLMTLPGCKLYVCKDMFLHTLGHKSDKVITSALLTTSPVGTNPGDKRGKHAPTHKITEEKEEFMVNHINSFKPQIAHYRREHAPNRLYLPPELTITEMYGDYVDECEKEGQISSISYVTYTRKLKAMNIGFAKLGNEDCECCDAHKLHIKIADEGDSSENEENGDDDDGDERVKKNGKIKKKKATFDKMKVCDDETCDDCKKWQEHIKRYNETRISYKKDKENVASQRDTLFLSSDMQKVILIPRLPGYKVCLFTKRIVVINQSFAPINKEEVSKNKALGVIWHEEICGRNDEDVTSAFLKAINFGDFRDFDKYVIWLDNCSGQNKNWTLYTALTNLVNSIDGPISVTLKYFTVGHTFMSADTFHKRVEGEMKKMKQVCDWNDFMLCVERSGKTYEMKVSDFQEHISGLSQSEESKRTRPLLENVSIAEFRKGSYSFFYKTSHNDPNFKEALYLQKKHKTSIMGNTFSSAEKKSKRGITASKKEHIIKNLGPLMKPSRRRFYEELVCSVDIPDLMDSR